MSANRLKAYFNFSKKERNGIIVLLVMLAAVWFAPLLFIRDKTFDLKGFASFEHDIAQLQQDGLQSGKDNDSAEIFYSSLPVSYTRAVKAETFYFDPNTLKTTEWQRLGISRRTIQTIQNFIAKGGRFYKAEDIGRIYGLKKQDYERLLPYVRIPAADTTRSKEKNVYPVAFAAGNTKYTAGIVHINAADTTAFIALPGIGSKLAGRIIRFREKLGGFYSVNQVAEVYGVSDSVFQQIKSRLLCDAATIKKININTAGIDELKAHPYIKYQVGNAVIQYRLQHGNFQNEDDLKQVHLVTDDLIQKCAPYITY